MKRNFSRAILLLVVFGALIGPALMPYNDVLALKISNNK